MARIRSVKPELFTHEGLFEAESDYKLPLRLAFIALFTQCDQWGRFCWQPKRLKLAILPYDEVDIAQVFDALAMRGFIEKYEVQGEWYGRILSWAKHQKITRPEHPSGIPSPEGFVPNKSTKKNLQKPKKSEPLIPLNDTLQPPTPIEVMQASLVPDSVHTENAYGCNPVDSVHNLVPTKEVLVCNTVATEHNLVQTEEVLGSNTVGIDVHTKNVLGGNTVGTEYNRGRTWYSGNMEYGNGIGNREYGKEYGVGKNTIVASELLPQTVFNTEPISKIFEHWQTVMKHPHSKLDPKRKVLIGKALDWGYSVEQICQAITGCSITPHNCGKNDRKERYDGLHVILGDSDQIDRFINNYHYPPGLQTDADRKTEANVQSLQRWIDQKMQEEYENAR